MTHDVHELAQRLMHKGFEALTPREQNVVRRFAERLHVSRNISREQQAQLTFGQRVADRVASFGGSWPFIGAFFGFLLVWVVANSFVLIHWRSSFDPYPYILLNLILSMLASIQAPVIMMSQNRQAVKDRATAEHDYEVNLKAELEIMALHEKVDALREKQWAELLAIQQEQVRMLNDLVGALRLNAPAGISPASSSGLSQ